MKIRFTKMHGLGNDFVVIDAITQPIKLTAAHYRLLGDRHLGIGCDQILLVEKSSLPEVDFAYRIFNNNGEEVEQCGNGARCFVRFVHEQGLTQKTSITVQTLNGLIYPTLEKDGQVTVNMGAPRFRPSEIPFVVSEEARTYPLLVAGQTYMINALSMGNPHAVQFVESVDQTPVEIIGPQIESHAQFPQKVNASFVQCLSPQHIKLRVFERGAGETLACGTGACAAVVAGIQRQLLESSVRVDTRGGSLTISWQGLGHPVLMTGPAVTVFHGEIVL
jgi:diaminopimelate epimerase